MSGMFSMRSPESGMYNYEWLEDNQAWYSKTHVHVMEELLTREFIGHTPRGFLNL